MMKKKLKLTVFALIILSCNKKEVTSFSFLGQKYIMGQNLSDFKASHPTLSMSDNDALPEFSFYRTIDTINVIKKKEELSLVFHKNKLVSVRVSVMSLSDEDISKLNSDTLLQKILINNKYFNDSCGYINIGQIIHNDNGSVDLHFLFVDKRHRVLYE